MTEFQPLNNKTLPKVSRETANNYLNLVKTWSEKMNLVARSQLPHLATRHWDDSAQLANYLNPGQPVIDLGSGAGFPGVVLALLGYQVICIESITKKAAFLTEVKNQLNLPNLTIWNDRIESRAQDIRRIPNAVFTARAFASLDKILNLTQNMGPRRYVLLKGRGVDDEIAAAKRQFSFDFKKYPSKTGDGFVLDLQLAK